MKRRIAVVTGTRAEYGALRSTILALRDSPRVELQVVATGLHLLRQFGRTIDDIRRDGVPIAATVPMQRGDDSATDQARGLARGVDGLARLFHRARTDIVVVLGDRIEAMAAALAATTTGRVVAHIHGGDVAAGDFDESLRHAITKLAHVHLTASESSRRRVIRLGEDARRVFLVGAPGLDDLRVELRARRGSKRAGGEALVVFHATGRDVRVERRAMETILHAVSAAGLRRRIIYPNSDRGHAGIVAAIEAHVRRSGNDAVAHRSLPRGDFLRALIDADLLIGNSSSGIIEAPLAGTATVNIGDRQLGREPGGTSIVHCGESVRALARAIDQAMQMRPRRGGRCVYGDGRSGPRIARILERVSVNARLVRKRIAY
ncbi:MAG: UDP-N-acetylglucosamine 2-epimerase [Phycisphaerae bacterium]